ncbi:acyl carrier protein [Paenibacillus pinihumi]|uniref:acyl carrier protein n=1 Tax=Paenibacillus pinihumi TaxID=669462 RepID=UPI0004268B7B|nr:phosphopantetheine-binding protein [Paenibacillus pinihumi]
MEHNSIAEKINKYVLDSVNIDRIDFDMDIFEEGLVSSLFAIELMTFLEKNFEIKITTNDLDMNNYKCINSITEFVCKKKAGDLG